MPPERKDQEEDKGDGSSLKNKNGMSTHDSAQMRGDRWGSRRKNREIRLLACDQ